MRTAIVLLLLIIICTLSKSQDTINEGGVNVIFTDSIGQKDSIYFGWSKNGIPNILNASLGETLSLILENSNNLQVVAYKNFDLPSKKIVGKYTNSCFEVIADTTNKYFRAQLIKIKAKIKYFPIKVEFHNISNKFERCQGISGIAFDPIDTIRKSHFIPVFLPHIDPILYPHYEFSNLIKKDEVIHTGNDIYQFYWQFSTGITPTIDLRNKDSVFKIFPNPVANLLHIKLEESLNSSLVHFEILNLNGKIVLKEALLNNIIDISILPAGIYFIKVRVKNYFIVEKILKN